MKSRLNEVIEVLEHIYNIKLYVVQIKAIKEMLKGNIVNVETGEGKTFIIAITAVVKALEGNQVVVITSNEYLNKRDFKVTQQLASRFGLGCVENEVIYKEDLELKTNIFSKDIIYSSCSEFIFDYLRGKSIKDFSGILLNKSLIIDEIDQILVDNSSTNFSISRESEEIRIEELELYRLASSICKMFIGGEIQSSTENLLIDDSDKYDFIYNKFENTLFLTERGGKKLTNLLSISLEDSNDIPIVSALLNTLRAKYLLNKGTDYVILDGELNNIDLNNGRFKKNTHFSSGIHLALELKEGLNVSSISSTDISINGLFFFSQFNDITGCSGSCYECRDLLYSVLKRPVKKIKRNMGMNIEFKPPRFFYTKQDKYEAIRGLLKELNLKGNPVLVVAEDDRICEDFFEYIKGFFPDSKLLTNSLLDQEEDIILESGREKSILVSTLISGRGTDIEIDKKLSNIGGLQVIFLSRFENIRAEKQIIGRTGRQGKRGRVYFFGSFEDKIFNGLLLADKNRLTRLLTSKRYTKIEKLIKKLQKKYKISSDSNILTQYKRNAILNMAEHYILKKTANTGGYLQDVEYFIQSYPLADDIGVNKCILETRDFIDKLLEEETNNEYNVKSSM